MAGFHTGRGVVSQFLEVATGEGESALRIEEDERGEDAKEKGVRGRLRAAELFEIDVNGVRRPWESVREGETKDEAKRWCVVAVLVRR